MRERQNARSRALCWLLTLSLLCALLPGGLPAVRGSRF